MPKTRPSLAAAFSGLSGLAAVACAGEQAPGRSVELRPCRLDGLGSEAQCGSHRVFENRTARAGRTIDLAIAVVPALASSPRRDPLFVLVGGPGQAASEAGGSIAEVLRDVRHVRDIVVI